MKRLSCMIGLFVLIAAVTGWSSSKSGSDSSQGTLHLSIMAANSSQTTTAGAPALKKVSPVLSINDFQSTSIASGPPQEFTISIKRMELTSDGGASRTIFDDPTGKPFTIAGSQIDLSSLFTNYACVDSAGNPVTLSQGQTCPCGLDPANKPILIDPATGKCPVSSNSTPPAGKLMVDTGVYKTLRITYQRKSQIKGCVTGNFSAGVSAVPGVHTYCTRAAFSTFKTPVGGQNADFENKPAEVMDFDLSKSDLTTDASQTLSMEYPIKDNITIGKDGTAQLTLLIDVNRMLRFFNQGRSDVGPNPNMPIDRSYFFTTVFDGSAFAFVGRPGTIRGYSFVTNACINATSIPADHICPPPADANSGIVAGWLTLVSAADNSPLLANFQPDDDNSLTVIKGSNMTLIGSQYGLDPSLITTNADSTLTIKFVLGAEGNGYVVYNFHPNIAVGARDESSYFEGLQHSYGTLVFVRGL